MQSGTRAALVALVVWFVACENPLSPEACGAVPDQTVAVGETVELRACFEDPNGESLVIAASSSDSRVATVLVRGSTVGVTAVSPGTALVTVVAIDPTGLEAQQNFRVVVPDRPPAAVGRIEDRELMVGDSASVDVASLFTEPDGQGLAYAAAASGPGPLVVSVQGAVVMLVAVAKGAVVVTVTATDPGGLAATQSFRVTVPNRPPVAIDSVFTRQVTAGGADTLDVEAFFTDPDGDALTYAAAVSDRGVAGVAVSGSVLTVTGLARGETTVTVTATDEEGLFATQRFAVTVPNRPPAVADAIAGRTIFRNQADTVALSSYFSDPDGDPLTWETEATDGDVVAVDVIGSDGALVVTALSQGEAVVTVTATDPEGLAAEQSFPVTVPNRAPMVIDTIPPRTTFKNQPDTVALARYFSDSDGDRLTWYSEASDAGVVAPAFPGSDDRLVVTGLAEGEAVITVTATDPGGLTAEQSFAVTVPNRGPVAADTIPAQTLYKRGTAPIDLTRHFSDPDADVLHYAIESTDTLVAMAEVTGTTIVVRAGVTGEATLTVTATDPGGLSARQSLAVTVLNRAPAVKTPIPAQTIYRQQSRAVDVSAHFGDSDGDTLSYRAVSSNPWVVRVRVDGSDVTLTAWSKGTVEVTVTATDPDGLTAEHAFTVKVGNRAPVPVGAFPDLELGRGDRTNLPIDRYFSDPDRDDLTYGATTSDPGIARAATRGNLVTITGVSRGEATLTLTATDPDSLTATHTSRVVVGEQGNTPAPVGAIPGQTIAEGSEHTLVVSGYFEDPNGDPLTYGATIGDPTVATASASGERVTIAGLSPGETTLTVTATDPGGLSATLTTPVTVVARGQGPVVVAPLPDQSVVVGRTRIISVAGHFQDPDGGSLSFSASSSDPSIVTAAASGSDVALTGVSVGRATVTVTASDADNASATLHFDVTVRAPSTGNRAPTLTAALADRFFVKTKALPVQGWRYFVDPDNDELTYTGASSNTAVATIDQFSDTYFEVVAKADGEAIITVIAQDPEGLTAEGSFTFTVGNNAPQVSDNAVSSLTSSPEQADSLTMGRIFEDSDGGDELSYSASSSSTDNVSARIVFHRLYGYQVVIKGVAVGQATVTLTATDLGGLHAQTSIVVTVESNAPPRVTSTFPSPISLTVGDTASYLLSDYFEDPDNDRLSYSVAVGYPVSTSISGDTLVLVAVRAGFSPGRVTAEDTGGKSASQTFLVFVQSAPAPEQGSPDLGALTATPPSSGTRIQQEQPVPGRSGTRYRSTGLSRESQP